MNLSPIGGPKYSKVVPCGVDLFNHDLSADSHLHWDSHFGMNLHEKSDIVGEIVWNIKEYGSPKPIDWASSWFWINDRVLNGTQIFVNYGTRHSSSIRLALYGFIDAVHPTDTFHLDFHLRPESEDRNMEFKKKYFATAWNSEYVQRKRIHSMQCHVEQDRSSWNALGRRGKYHHNVPIVQQRVLTPPLRMKYDGRRRVSVKEEFLRYLRLAYVPEQYFDSFTISSILNDAEYEYLKKVIDPHILSAVRQHCIDRLERYPTTLMEDRRERLLNQREREKVLRLMEFNVNGNHSNQTAINGLKDELRELDRKDLVLRYRIREKGYWSQCTRLEIEPTKQYMQTIKRKQKRKKTKFYQPRRMTMISPQIQKS